MNYKDDLGALAEKFKLAGKQITSSGGPPIRDISAELAREVGRIVKRTQAGRDKNEQPFTKYADSTVKSKTSAGRVRKADNKLKVDLTYTGAMLSALHWKIEQASNGLLGKIFISGEQARKALFHIQGDGLPKRDFLGFTEIFIKNIKLIITKALAHDR